jgi:hypothetical protein
VSTKEGQRIVGAEIPRAGIGKVLRSLGLGNPCNNPEQVFASVFEQGDQIELACKMHLKRTILQREPAIELVCVDADRFGELRRLGLINEQIKYKQRFFVPTDAKLGLPILTKLLDLYPVIGPDSDAEEAASIIDAASATEVKVVCVEQWVLPPGPAFLSASSPEPDVPTLIDPGLIIEEPEMQPGPSMAALIEQYSPALNVRPAKRSRPRVEEQGVLFSFH